MRLVQVMENTPAEAAGLLDEDLIVAIEGAPAAGMDQRDVVRAPARPDRDPRAGQRAARRPPGAPFRSTSSATTSCRRPSATAASTTSR